MVFVVIMVEIFILGMIVVRCFICFIRVFCWIILILWIVWLL